MIQLDPLPRRYQAGERISKRPGHINHRSSSPSLWSRRRSGGTSRAVQVIRDALTALGGHRVDRDNQAVRPLAQLTLFVDAPLPSSFQDIWPLSRPHCPISLTTWWS